MIILLVLLTCVSVSVGQQRTLCSQSEIECPEVDGLYPKYTALKNCSQFCQCSNGKPYLHNCTDGLHFNSILNVCDHPERAGCTSHNNPSEISNEGCAGVNIECPAVDGKYPVYSLGPNCSQFCQCSNGKAYLHNCPTGLHFNTDLNVCDYPERAGCSSNVTPDDNSDDNNDDDDDNNNNEPSDDSNKGCDGVDIECPAVDGKYPVYSLGPNCSQFCQCSNGKAYLHNCPTGLHFNTDLNVCDYPERAGCSSNVTPDDNSDDNNDDDDDDNNNNEPSDDSNKGCDGVDIECPAVDGKYPVYSLGPNCSQFCQCSNGKAYLHNCPTGLHFNTDLNVCDYPERAGCSSNVTPDDNSDDNNDDDDDDNNNNEPSDDSNKGCDGVDIECPAVDGKYPVYSLGPNCSQFCQCSNGKAYLHNCPTGLHFNTDLNVCDYPERAGCSSNVTPDDNSDDNNDDDDDNNNNEPSDDSNKGCDGVDIECPAVDGKYPVYSLGPNCSQFCQCSNGKAYLHNCPTGLHFNTDLNVCDYPERAGCSSNVTPDDNSDDNNDDDDDNNNNEPSDDSNKGCDGVDIECPAVDGKYPVYSLGPNCSQFCQCSNGKAYLHNCPTGLHFNTDLNVCDYPERAGCSSNVTPDDNSDDNNDDDDDNNNNEPSDDSNKGCDDVDIECPAVDGKYPVYSLGPNCSQFCQCSNGKAYLHNCPTGLHFNTDLNVCDYPERAGCSSNVTPDDNSDDNNDDDDDNNNNGPSDDSNKGCDGVDIKCPAVDGKYPVYSLGPNCSQFCQCSNGKAYLHNCPTGLHFNTDLNVCDYPERAGCSSNVTPDDNSDDNNDDDDDNNNNEPSDDSNKGCDGVDIECPAVDGKYPVYSLGPNCSQFCQCSNGKAYLHNCPTGLHFNTDLNVCDYPERAGCSSNVTPDDNSDDNNDDDDDDNNNNEPSDDSNKGCDGVDIECPAVDGKYPVYSLGPNCSQFCQCSNGKAYLHNCPTGLHFNTDLNVCDYPERAGCSSNVTPDDNSDDNNDDDDDNNNNEPSDDSNKGCDGVDIECPAVDGKYPVYSLGPNCSQFCQCSNGKAYLHNCPTGLHFNTDLNVCDYPERAGCSSNVTPDDNSDDNNDDDDDDNNNNEPSDDSNKGCDDVDIECPAVDGKYPVYSLGPNCSQFCQCSNGKAYLHNCPTGLHFNTDLNVCDYPERAGCSSNVTPDDNSDDNNDDDDDNNNNGPSDDSNKGCDGVDIKCPAVDGKYPVYSLGPNCSQFCQCSNGKAYLHNCPTGLHFNTDLNVCDYPERAGCSSNVTPDDNSDDNNDDDDDNNNNEPSDDSNKGCDGVDIECPAVDGKYPVYSLGPNCSQFCQCSNGKAYLHNCPTGLHFNTDLNVCDYPERAGCSSNVTPDDNSDDNNDDDDDDNNNNEPSDDSNKGCDGVDIECPAVDGKYPVYSLGPNCSQFCQCTNGKAYLHNCPTGLHFNTDLNVCDYPERAGCSSNVTPDDNSDDNNDDDDDNNNNEPSDDSNKGCDGVDIECPAVDGKYPVYSLGPNCSQFCQCSNGKAYLHNCPTGLHFNTDLNVCDYPERAGCSSNVTPDDNSDDNNDDDDDDNNNNEPSDDSNKGCDGVDIECPAVDGKYPVYSLGPNCSQFCQCSNGKAYLHNCPTGLHFNTDLNVCDYPERAGCSSNVTPDDNSDDNNDDDDDDNNNEPSDDSNKGCDGVDIECPAVDGKYPVYSLGPNCSQFCQCSNGKAYLHNCPTGLHFNTDLNVCDYPERAGCSSNVTPDDNSDDNNDYDDDNNNNDPSDDSNKGCDGVDIECPAVDGKYPVYSLGPNCSQFCQCSNGKAYLHNCPTGLHFNTDLNVCDYPERAGCSSNVTPDDNSDDNNDDDDDNNNNDPSDDSNKGCDGVDIECPAVDGKYPVYSLGPNCSQFCQCSNGKAYLHNCPTGLHFNTDLNVCDYPERAGCSSNVTPDDNSDDNNDDDDDDNNNEPSDDSNKGCDGVDIECPAVDGKYPVYSLGPNCSQFCQCSNGKAYLHNCPTGLHFNTDLNVCDYPERAGCSSNVTPDDNSDDNNNDDDDNNNNEPSDDSNKGCDGVDIECPAVDGKYPVYSLGPNCSQFCQCSNGKAYLHNCPTGLHFNTDLNVCDYPERAGCSSNVTPDDNSDDNNDDDDDNNNNEPSDDSNKGCDGVDIECPAVDGKYPVYSLGPNCSQFCQCSNGKAYLHNCPSGLHFNTDLNVCDYPERAGCSSNVTPDDNSDDNNDDDDDNNNNDPSDDSNKGCDGVDIECPAVDGKYPVYSLGPNCSQFCQCSNGKAYLHNCPTGLHFNTDLNVCDYPERAGCSSNVTPDDNSDDNNDDDDDNNNNDPSDDSNKGCDGVDIECPAVDGKYPVYSLGPNCSQFCQCSNGKAYLHNCPTGLHFNTDLNVCDYPERAGCSSNVTPDDNSDDNNDDDDDDNNNEPSDDSNKGCDGVDIECPAVDGKYPVYSLGPNCSQFCQCSNGKAYLHNCPTGLHFNTDLNVCDYPERAGCSSNVTPDDNSDDNNDDDDDNNNNEPSDDSNKGCDGVDIECPAVDGKYPVYSLGPNCSQFCQCSNGKAYLHNCPSGLHFNTDLNVCDYPERAGCSSNVTPDDNSDDNNDDDDDNNNNDPSDDSNKGCDGVDIECPAVDGKYPVYSLGPNCSQFCQCSNGKAYLHNCPTGLHFNTDLNVCDYPERAGCSSNVTPDDNSDDNNDDDDDNNNNDPSDDSNKGCDGVDIECPAVDGKYPVYSLGPNCSQFCQCSNGKAYLHNCPTGLHFNTDLNVCDYPERAGCSSNVTPDDNSDDNNDDDDDNNNNDPSDDSNKGCDGVDIECPAVDGKYPVYSLGPNCSQFCQCSNGKAYLHNCPTGLHFNTDLNVCDYPERAGCSNKGCDGLNIKCPAVDGKYPVYSPGPTCSQFCQCSNGIPYLFNCSSELHFNSVLNVCDYPENAGCVNSYNK